MHRLNQHRELEKNESIFKLNQNSSNEKMNCCYNYDILANPAYQERFAYIPSHMLNRLTYICCDEYEHLTNVGEQTKLIVQRTGKVGYIDTKISNRETILAAKCQGDYCRLVLDLPF